MKISRKTIVYLGIGVYVIIVASLGYILFGQLEQKDTLDAELAVSRTNLERLNPENLSKQNLELEEKLTHVTSQVDTLKSMLSQGIGNIAASNTVFETARTCGVQVITLVSPSPVYEVLEDVPCMVVFINATVEGEVDDLVTFITRLNSSLPTGMIQSVNMSIPEPEESLVPTADILLTIFNYKGN